MSKFEKRILKSSRHCRNCFIVGSGLGLIEDLIKHCNTLFVIYNDLPKIRNGKMIYRENFENIEQLYDIDFVFLDYDHHQHLSSMKNMLLKCRPIIFVGEEKAFPVETYKYLNGLGFVLVEIFKNMQKWIPK